MGNIFFYKTLAQYHLNLKLHNTRPLNTLFHQFDHCKVTLFQTKQIHCWFCRLMPIQILFYTYYGLMRWILDSNRWILDTNYVININKYRKHLSNILKIDLDISSEFYNNNIYLRQIRILGRRREMSVIHYDLDLPFFTFITFLILFFS